MVALLAGQSNAANNATITTNADPRVVNFYKGRCYVARDPLLGATGDYGSVWIPLANSVVAEGRADAVILVPAAVGSSTMDSWAPGGLNNERIEQRLDGLAKIHLKPTHVFIQQGEFEGVSHGDPVAYERRTRDLLSQLRATGAQVYMATATRCLGAANQKIAHAQDAARRAEGAVAGPDADAIPNEERVHGCHYNAEGARHMAEAWRAVLDKPRV